MPHAPSPNAMAAPPASTDMAQEETVLKDYPLWKEDKPQREIRELRERLKESHLVDLRYPEGQLLFSRITKLPPERAKKALRGLHIHLRTSRHMLLATLLADHNHGSAEIGDNRFRVKPPSTKKGNISTLRKELNDSRKNGTRLHLIITPVTLSMMDDTALAHLHKTLVEYSDVIYPPERQTILECISELSPNTSHTSIQDPDEIRPPEESLHGYTPGA